MSVRAQLVSVIGDGRKRAAVRRKLRLAAAGSTNQGTENVNILNFSATGMLIESTAVLAMGESLQVELPQAGPTRATIVWSSGNFFGCRFRKPLSSATMSAVLLKGKPARPLLAVDRSDNSERLPFPVQMRQLRERRGLSLQDLAQRLGVSRQAVWYWEKGRSLPSQDNVARLAHFLGVRELELLPSPTDNAAYPATNLAALIDARKAEIAQLAGTSNDKVRIIIEL